MKYYIAENGQPAGPFELKELLEHGLTVNSQVWNESMDNWTSATQVPEVYQLLRGAAATSASNVSAYQSPVYPPNEQASPVAAQSQYAPPAGYEQQGNQPVSPYSPQQPYSQPQQPYFQPQQPYAQPQYSGAQPGAPYYGERQYAQPQYAQPVGHMPNDWKVANIIITILSVLCCCNPISMITGIIGWVKSGNVRTLFNHGDQLAAEEAASSARMWFYISLAILAIGAVMSMIFLMSNPEMQSTFRQSYESVGASEI